MRSQQSSIQVCLESCPPEIIFYICELSCSFRALTRVSRYFHEITTPLQYETVEISSMEVVSALVERLEGTKEHLRRIYHLFLSLSNKDKPSSSLARLLSMASPTLSTFCAIASTSILAQIFRTNFPQLMELSVIGMYPFPSTPNSFPRLRRLELNGNRNPHGLIQLGCLKLAFPSLRDLSVKGLRSAGSFLKEMEEESETENMPSFPSQLQSIRLQRGAVDGAKINPARVAEEVAVFERIRRLKVKNAIAFSVMEEMGRDYEIVEGCRRDWAARLIL
ncbi:hypothetical protein C8J56DRAFT_959296 [Mycena floridula]|nr:hypothetical protein C8J56DRAFT_959296 [Mycena floridula]